MMFFFINTDVILSPEYIVVKGNFHPAACIYCVLRAKTHMNHFRLELKCIAKENTFVFTGKMW